MTKEFECTREVVLPADPDRVFEAVSTVAGVTAWLFPTPVPGPDEAVTWDPPHRFRVRMEQGEWFNALEYTIEGMEGGKAVLRYVHSGVFMDDWDTQYDAVQQHTDFYLNTLGLYLEEAKNLLQKVQTILIDEQVRTRLAEQMACPDCARPRAHKDTRTIVSRTLFGTLHLRSPRWHPMSLSRRRRGRSVRWPRRYPNAPHLSCSTWKASSPGWSRTV